MGDDMIECSGDDCTHTTTEKHLSDSGRCYVCESRHRKRQQSAPAVDENREENTSDKADTTIST